MGDRANLCPGAMARAPVSPRCVSPDGRAAWIVGLVPLAVFVLPALAGHPLLFGDNATQNTPLRALVGSDLRHGVLPGWNPYSWSGVPLLAGFNAGAFSPFILPFLVLPSGLAFSVAIGAAYGVIAAAVLATARTLGVSLRIASAAGLVAAMTGALIAQSVHMDMIEGDAGWVVALLFLARLARGQGDRRSNALGLAAGFAADILAGAPEAMLVGLVVLGASALGWLAARRLGPRDIVAISLAAILSLALSGIQWIPGLAFTAISTRAHLPPNFAGSGPFSGIFAPLAVYPMAYGGYLIPYFGNYNPYEVNLSITYVGLVFLAVAAVRPRLSTLAEGIAGGLWGALLVSLLFALGGHTPFAHLVYHLPLFDLQRLAARYLVGVDVPAILLAAGALDAVVARPRILLRDRRLRWTIRLLAAGSLAFGLCEIVATHVVLSHANVTFFPSGAALWALRGYLVVTSGLVALVSVILLRRPLDQRTLSTLAIVALIEVLNQVAQFPVLSSLSPPLAHPRDPTVADLVHPPARYVLYDPNLYLYEPLIATDAQPDTNIYTGTWSASGYSSLGLARYQAATGTKPESTFDPARLETLARDYNTRLVVTSRRYFWTYAPRTSALARTPSPLDLAQGSLSVFTGDVRATQSVDILLPGRARSLTAVVHLASGTLERRRRSSSSLTIRLPRPMAIEAVSVRVDGAPSRDIRILVHATSGAYLIGGPLSRALSPDQWRQITGAGGSLDFLLRHASATWAMPAGGVRVRTARQDQAGTIALQLTASHPIPRLTLPFAGAPGWEGAAAGRPVPVWTAGTGQLSVGPLPSGDYTLLLTYHPPRLALGAALSAAGLGALGLGTLVRVRRRTKVPTT